MKSTNSHPTEETVKSHCSKVTKKPAKSRKSKQTEQAGVKAASSNNHPSVCMVTTPTTPTTTTTGNVFDSALGAAGGSSSGGVAETSCNNISRSSLKSYAGLEPRSIKSIWEQYGHGDYELTTEASTRIAEDASYKLWELVNSTKIYANHSGCVMTYDVVNEAMRDANVTPALGPLYTDWDRIVDYAGTYFFYSDKSVELREDFQKEETVSIPAGLDFKCSFPVEDRNIELLQQYTRNIFSVCLFGEHKSLRTGLNELAFSPIIGSCYRVLLTQIIQLLSFRQLDELSAKCWRILRACVVNSRRVRDVDCREEYFHLTELLICHLLAPYETIVVHSCNNDNEAEQQELVKMEIDVNVKIEDQSDLNETALTTDIFQAPTNTQEQKVYELDNNDDDVDDEAETNVMSPFYASAVDWNFVDELCTTIGQLSNISGYFQSECRFHIVRRLERFFTGRVIQTEKEYKYISRIVRGLIALGDYAFREFIPFLYKFSANDVPEYLWNDFALAAVFLKGPDDIFLYEWLEFVCGSDKLQPFMVYYAQYYEKFLTWRFLNREKGTYKIYPKISVRRLEWSLLAAAMCHGDDPNKALKPKPTISEVFPELIVPNLQLNRAGTIRFKFAGCRPVIIKPKVPQLPIKVSPASVGSSISGLVQNDIFIARCKLMKPFTNEKRIKPLSSYYYLRI